MAEINLKKADIPFWAGGEGILRVHAIVADPTKPLTPTNDNLFGVNFNAEGSQPFSIGAHDSFKFGIKAGTNTDLIPLWATSSAERLKILDEYGLSDYFKSGAHQDRLLLLLTVGANADASLSAKFKYLNLSATATLEAGTDANYALVRSFPANTASGALVRDFFKGLRLPANIDAPLDEAEAIFFEYGGYLGFKGNIGVGYEIRGSSSFQINQLQLSEKYGFSLMAKLGLNARIAGRFRVEVREGTENNWVRIVVRKSRDKSYSIAADVKATATFKEEGLPDSPDEFLSAVIGLKSKNWLNMFDQVRKLTDFQQLDDYLDNLAKAFIEEYTGKVFVTLADRTQLDEIVDLAGRVIDQYNDVGNHAVTLFDRYFDIAKNAVDERLGDALEIVKNATSWDQLKGEIDETLWEVVQQLTDGDPLGWMLGKIEIGGHSVNSLDEIKHRADQTLELIRKDVHRELRRLIALAKSKFPLDKFISELDQISWTELKSISERRLTGFVERLIGKSIDKLSSSELGDTVEDFHKILVSINDFKDTLYDKIKATLDQSFQFHLSAAYSREEQNRALVDFELDLASDKGKELMKQAGRGNFDDVLAGYASGSVKLHEGILTHKVTRESNLNVNIVGWHTGWHYTSLHRLITEAEQRIIPQGDGQLNVITTLDMKKEDETKNKRNGERVYTNFLLRFIGESRGVVEFDKSNQMYLIDSIKRMSANYQLVMQDKDTDAKELARYLSFADDFGLTKTDDAALRLFTPLLPTDDKGHFGETSVTYNVRFTEEGLQTLFTKPFTQTEEILLRRTMRLIVLANYIAEPLLADISWGYWSPKIRETWAQGPSAFTNAGPLGRTFDKTQIAQSPFVELKSPNSITLSGAELSLLHQLFTIEEDMIKGMRSLATIVQSQNKMKPRDFEKAMGDFGKALDRYDRVDKGQNTVFALFDWMIQRNSEGMAYRNSSLDLKSKLNGEEFTKMLIA